MLNIFKSKDPFKRFITQLIGYAPNNMELYTQAFTHSSMNAHKGSSEVSDNERLEFLGDSVLGSIVAIWLYENYPTKSEGELTVLKSKIVKRDTMNDIAKNLGIPTHIKTAMSRVGENVNGNVLEAFIGALYLDKGYTICQRFIHKKMIKENFQNGFLEESINSHKSHFIEWCQGNKIKYEYDVQPSGSEKNPQYIAEINADGRIFTGIASSKKKAEEIASTNAYYSLVEKPKII
jgi:ribonuclease-3